MNADIQAIVEEHLGVIDLAHPDADVRTRLGEAFEAHLDEKLKDQEDKVENKLADLDKATETLAAIANLDADSWGDLNELLDEWQRWPKS